jgi:hypothetical protein
VLFHEHPTRSARFGAFAATLGAFEIWRRRTHFVVTTHRVLAFRGLVSRDQQEIPLRLVARADARRSGLASTVWVATVGGALGTQPMGPMGREQAEAFAEAITRARAA